MKHLIQYGTFSIILVSYISSLNAFRLDMPGNLKAFSRYLLFVFIGESFAFAWPRWLYQLTSMPRGNAWMYNILHLIFYVFLIWFFYSLLKIPLLKKLGRVLGLVLVLFAITNMCFFQGMGKLNNYTELLAAFILVFLSLAYYYQLLHNKEVVSLHRDPYFWISTGVFVNHLGSVMSFFLIDVMGMISEEGASKVHMVIVFSGLLMYLTFIIAFLCPRKK
jgi:hypothetical protein